MRHLRSGTSVTTPSTELGSVLLAALLLLLLCIGGPFGFAGSGVAAAAPDPFTVDIVAVDAETGDPIPSFKWLINIDNSHANPSVHAARQLQPGGRVGRRDHRDRDHGRRCDDRTIAATSSPWSRTTAAAA